MIHLKLLYCKSVNLNQTDLDKIKVDDHNQVVCNLLSDYNIPTDKICQLMIEGMRIQYEEDEY